MFKLRKIVAVSLAGSACVLIAAMFMWLVEPAAAREVDAACTGLRPAPRSKTIAEIPTQAPDFSVVDRQGKVVKLSDYRGKTVMVNFWASWCGTCEAEKPSLERLQRDLGGGKFAVLALASDASYEPIDAKYKGKTPLNVLLDKPEEEGGYGAVAKAWGIQAVPESFIVDKRGMIRHYFINKRDWDSSIATTCMRALADE